MRCPKGWSYVTTRSYCSRMTTAHRPTWAPAQGAQFQGGRRLFATSKAFSSKDATSKKELKERLEEQENDEVERTDLKAELEQKEREYLRAQGKLPAWDTSEALFLEDTSAERNEFEEPESNKHDSGGDSLEEDSLGEDASEESDEDDTELLLAELEKIKRERADEAARKARLHPASEEHGTVSGLFDQNPLLSQEEGRSSFAVKKSWRDDVVFRNQANHETKKQKRFVNDTVRNDFHKQFLDKYVR